jgi:hypothetical protein
MRSKCILCRLAEQDISIFFKTTIFYLDIPGSFRNRVRFSSQIFAILKELGRMTQVMRSRWKRRCGMNESHLHTRFGAFLVAIGNGPIEIVDLPMKNGWISDSYVNVYQRVKPPNHKFNRP